MDKPRGISSFGALRQLDKKFSIKKTHKKIGHGGTLDPEASGLLVVAIGTATRLLRFFLGSDKRYLAELRLGERTATDDAEGEVIAAASYAHIGYEDVQRALTQFRGDIEQVPPSFSALHVDGRRAYDLARRGESLSLPPRRVTIHAIETVSCGLPAEPCLRLDIACSGGTYIRSIARDLGEALGSCAHLSGLRRTRSCHFDLSLAHPLDFFLAQDDLAPFLLSVQEALPDFTSLPLPETQIDALLGGRHVDWRGLSCGNYNILPMGSSEVVAIVEVKAEGTEVTRLVTLDAFRRTCNTMPAERRTP
ncbi:MAG: tRNA pseudouridine(55) synthase TruB [Proteobacteria bacterium]|nr:tRNA pseudouridine(55) synthase TruB [Pseudomonadota bacterium]